MRAIPIGCTLTGIIADHRARLHNRIIVMPGGEVLANMAIEDAQDLNVPSPVLAPINSVPATFSGDAGAPTESVTFAVLAGTYTSAVWQFQGNADNTQGYSEEIVTAGPDIVDNDPPGHSSGPFNFSIAASANQLADINAAAGGNLAVTMNMNTDPGLPGWTINITSFTLTLVPSGTGGGTGQVQVWIPGVHDPDDPDVDRIVL